RVVIETARRLVPLGTDVLKAEFPVHPADSPDESEWDDACRELTAVCPVPWVLLSAGVSHDVFLRQTAIACRAGARGVIAGRAIWSEAIAITPDPDARRRFLEGPARQRLETLRALCQTRPLPPGSHL
ncbi:MAG: tagatose-bisphosphate aldolase, partial [Verrucomicrobiae bacterium]|nr:tagatose-bisphosphate aldolase [Verrucomicrobiae bacterium]